MYETQADSQKIIVKEVIQCLRTTPSVKLNTMSDADCRVGNFLTSVRPLRLSQCY